jgi:two-component system sensor histidine kinase KdpD
LSACCWRARSRKRTWPAKPSSCAAHCWPRCRTILGAATSLRTQGDKLKAEARAELLETIEEEAERLNRFVQNLLDMTRLGHGKLELKRDWCGLTDLLEQARADLVRELAGFEVVVDGDRDTDFVHVDPTLIEQVFVNVLDNAAKYSPRGGTIFVTVRQDDEQVVIDVEDQGPGIPAADRERIFDVFYRVQGRDHVKPGTGLGLSICRGLLQAHGGSIQALSGARGSGARIRITLPRSRQAMPRRQRA